MCVPPQGTITYFYIPTCDAWRLVEGENRGSLVRVIVNFNVTKFIYITFKTMWILFVNWNNISRSRKIFTKIWNILQFPTSQEHSYLVMDRHIGTTALLSANIMIHFLSTVITTIYFFHHGIKTKFYVILWYCYKCICSHEIINLKQWCWTRFNREESIAL